MTIIGPPDVRQGKIDGGRELETSIGAVRRK